MAELRDASVPGVSPLYKGKVRDVYDLGERLLIVTTDRISAFDQVLPQTIPQKGSILTGLSLFWFQELRSVVANHLIAGGADLAKSLPAPFAAAARVWGGRAMLVRKLKMFPIECVVRGYLAGSGWKEYRKDRTVCGIPLKAGLLEASELDEPIFTPATKATTGHDINISMAEAERHVGREAARELKRISLELYSRAREYARARGVILADTKFEFGVAEPGGAPVLGDEVLTPDSSRYWPLDTYKPGGSPPSFDKQFVRDYLQSVGWAGDGVAPNLPKEVIAGTAARYREIYLRLTGKDWSETS
ncbi:MAG: phosphoribosylaminoimidazolesuccinocarboxamide synthase [Planctomycetota bacterium]